MSAAIKQIVTVRPGGVVELQSPELREGDRAEVTVVVMRSAESQKESRAGGGWRRFAGAAKGSDSRAGDNSRVDADLAAEYGSAPTDKP